MSLLDKARQDAIWITTNDVTGFAQDVEFIYPGGVPTVTIKARHTSHHNAVDTDGVQVDAKIASVAVAEKVLNDAGYITRNAEGVVTFEGHKINAKDSTGVVRNYIVRQKFPDSSIGIIVILLTDYNLE